MAGSDWSLERKGLRGISVHTGIEGYHFPFVEEESCMNMQNTSKDFLSKNKLAATSAYSKVILHNRSVRNQVGEGRRFAQCSLAPTIVTSTDVVENSPATVSAMKHF